MRRLLSGFSTVLLLGLAFACGGGGGPAAAPFAAPVITSFTVTNTPITSGTGTTLTAVFSNGTASIDRGIGAVTSGAAVGTGNLTADTTFTLTVTNNSGASVTKTVTVVVVATPVAAITGSFPAGTMVAPGAQGIQAQVSDQPGCTFTWAVSGGTIDAGAATRAVTCTAGSGGTFSLSVTVTNAAGSTAQGTYNLSIAAPPQPLDVTVTEELAPGMAEATASVPEIAGATYNWTLTGGTITAGAHGPMVTFTTADTAPAGVQALAANCGTVILTHVLQHPNGSKYGSTKTIPVNCDPNANVRAPLTVAPSQAGLVASVHEQNHCTYSWTVVNGAIASGQGTHRITFAAGSTGTITLTCKVTNQSGNSKTGSAIVIIVESTPSISYTPSSHTLVRGAAVSPIVPTNTGGAATSWSIAPALPTGLAFSPSTGTINGSPQTLLPPTAFTVTAANAGGSGTAQLNLAVNDVPSSISYTPSVVVLTVGSILQPLAPTNTGGAITSWSVTPALPSGLTFSTITGVFAGTPVALSPATTYTVTATYVGGTATAQVTITVNDKLPIITYPGGPFRYYKGAAIPPLAPTTTGGAALSWSITPALPAGLSFSTTSGVISGTPMMLTPSTSYTVKASNTGGEARASISIAIIDPPPSAPVVTMSGVQITGHPLAFNLSAIDPQGLPITFSVAGATSVTVGPTGGSGTFTWTPPVQSIPSAQSLSLTVTAKNSSESSSAASTITWSEAPNRRPHFSSLANPPAFTGTLAAFNVSYTVAAQDLDSDELKMEALSNISVVDNNGAAIAGATPSINATNGLVSWSGTLPPTAQSAIATFTVTVKDYLPGTSIPVGGVSTQVVTLTYVMGNVAPTIVTNSLPSLPANHYIPWVKPGPTDPPSSIMLQCTDPNTDDMMTWRLVSSTTPLSLIPGPDQYSRYLVSAAGFVPRPAGSAYTVTVGVSDGHNPEVQKTFTINVVADSIPTHSASTYTETVSGVNFFNTAKVRLDVTVPGSVSPALRFPITNPATARQRFYPGGINWLDSYAAYAAGETFAGPSGTEAATYDNAFSNYGAYPTGFLGALTDEGKVSYGWNARTSFNDTEGDRLLYRLQGGSVYLSGTLFNTVGQPFTVSGVDGAATTQLPILGETVRIDEYPAIDPNRGTLLWRPVLFEAANNLATHGSLTPARTDAFGNSIWVIPAVWVFTVEALEKVYNPLGTGNAPGDVDYDLVFSPKGVHNLAIKVQPNNRPIVGSLVTIPGASNAVPGVAANQVHEPTTTLAVGGGVSNSPTTYGRPSIQEPESRRYDIAAGTGFDYTQKNTAKPAVWRWLLARAGGNADPTLTEDVEIYDPDRTSTSGHQDTIVASMDPLTTSGIPGDPLPGDISNNVPAVDAASAYFLNPWITAGDAGAFQVNWGPNRNQYLLARVAGTMNLTLPVDVRDQYQRRATASTSRSPIFGTVRITNHRVRVLHDSAAESAYYGNYEKYGDPARMTTDGVGHYGDNTVGGAGTHSAAVFTYLPFPSTLSVDETNFGSAPHGPTHLLDGTGPASGVIGSGAAGRYTTASWITLYATESPQTGFHTGNPLNDDARFNPTAYASALNSAGGRSDWKTFSYGLDLSGNPINPVEERRGATGTYADHEYRAQVIPSNSPWLWGRTSVFAQTPYSTLPMGWTGNTNEAPRLFGSAWYSTANSMGAYGPIGYIYGVRQGEVDAQTALAGRANAQSSSSSTTLRWTYSWPTQVTNVNLKASAAVGTPNHWRKGDVMEIAVPNMGQNGRFFFAGDGSQSDVQASELFGWGWLGMSSTVGVVDTQMVFGAGTTTPSGFSAAENTPFHVPSNSVWVPNNRSGTFLSQHQNLPNRTTYLSGTGYTALSFTGIKGYMQSSLATTALVDPSFRMSENPPGTGPSTYPGLISLTESDNVYFFWLRQDGNCSTAWGSWDASRMIPGSSYSALGGLTTVPPFAMVQGGLTDPFAMVSLATPGIPGQNHPSNVDVSTDLSLYNGNIAAPTGWARSQWGLLTPKLGPQPGGTSSKVRLVNPKFDSASPRFSNATAGFFSSLATSVSTEGGFRDSATVYAIRRHSNEQGSSNAELGLAGIEPGSPLLAQWYNLQLAGDPALDGATVGTAALTDVTAGRWPDVFSFYSPFAGDPAWANVLELKMNFLVGVAYPNGAPVTLVKVPAVIANLFPLGAPVTDPTCPNPGNTINPALPILGPVRSLQINDYKTNYTGPNRVLSTLILTDGAPTHPVSGAGASSTGGGNTHLQALGNTTLQWRASTACQVIPSGYYVELFQLTSNTGADVNQPILLATFRTGHIGTLDNLQVMHLPSMHSFSGRRGAAGVANEAAYFFKIRTLWYSGIQMEKTPLKQAIPMAYADFVSTPFVTQ